jgi:putative transposase
MKIYKRHRFPPDIISYAVWLYYRFNLSHRDIEDLLAERGITVSREAIRLWYPKHSLRSWGRLCIKFGAIYSGRLKRKHRGYGDTFFIDEVFVKINGKQHYLWRAVDQDGEVVDVFLQSKRDGVAAKRFVTAHAAVQNLFNLGWHLVRAEHYRNLRTSAFTEWSRAAA